MNEQDELIEMWCKAWPDKGSFVRASAQDLEAFAKLVAERERERIIAKNAPVIKQCNDYIKSLEDELAAIRARETKGNQDAKVN